MRVYFYFEIEGSHPSCNFGKCQGRGRLGTRAQCEGEKVSQARLRFVGAQQMVFGLL